VTTHRISAAERRARIAVRHHVAPAERVASVLQVARDMVCLHATDPTTVYVSVRARMIGATIEAVDRELYDDRRLVRMLAMRRTMFVVPVDDLAMVNAAASLGVARTQRRRSEQLVAMLGVDDPAAWLREAESATLAALGRRGEATAREVAEDVPALRQRARVNVGKKYEADLGMAGRVLLQLAVDGRVVRARPRGTWISSQYRWAPLDRWLGRPLDTMPVEAAQVTLVRRWLERFGPGTEADIRWWTGLGAREVRAALAGTATVAVDLDGASGYVLADDLDSTPRPEPWVALLPALDATTMGWQARDWYLGPHKARLFDSNGNAGATIWVDGRIVGGWAVRPTGDVVTRLLDDVGRERAREVDAEADRLSKWYGSVRVQAVPRFPTPLYRELVG
jgi:hypothetical protein